MKRIINPKTKKYIHVDGPNYNKLVEEGYTKSYLNSLQKVSDLQLAMVTDQPITYNDDVMNVIIGYLPLNELFALYHTNKHLSHLLNNPELLNALIQNFEIDINKVRKPITTFMQFIDELLYDVYKYDMQELHTKVGIKKPNYYHNVIRAYNMIYNQFLKNKLISMCKTRRTTNTELCHAKHYLQKNGYTKEVDILSSSKNNEEYKHNLSRLEYAIYYNLLSTI